MRGARVILLTAMLALCLGLSGCGSLQFSPEDLMRPPVMTEQQTEIYKAAAEIIGNNVTFRYPSVGGTHSAFVMYDYDGDGEEECLVFYQNEADTNARMNVLDRRDGAWFSIGDVEGAGTNVDHVDFTNLDAQARVDVVIEWSNVSPNDRTVTVLSLEDGRLITRFSSAFATKTIFDIDKDGVDELVLLTGNYGTSQAAALLVESTEDGTLAVTSSCTMSPDTYEYVQVLNSITSGGDAALVIDCAMSEGALTSEIVAFEQGKLVNLVYSDLMELDNTFKTYRANPVLSSDIDYDGTVEIPALQALPSADSATVAFEPVYLTNWMKLRGGQFETVLSAVVNEAYGYYFIFPDRWEGKVTVSVERANEWVFWSYTNESAGYTAQLEQMLLRIKVFAKTDYYDDFDTEGYEKLYENDAYDFYASVNYVANSDLQLTLEELDDLFVPIST